MAFVNARFNSDKPLYALRENGTPYRKPYYSKPDAHTFGIEIELELRTQRIGDYFQQVIPGWAIHEDGSLRNGLELVSDGPVGLAQLDEHLAEMTKAIHGWPISEDAPRTSLHVHINCTNYTPYGVVARYARLLLFEQALIRFSGETRQSNLFCLSVKDAKAALIHLCNSLANNRDIRHVFGGNGYRYTTLNLNSIDKYGTIEVRCMRSTTDPALIRTWVLMLDRIINAPFTPQNMPYEFSNAGPLEFAKRVLGEYFYVLQPTYEELMNGIRLVQEIGWAIEGEWNNLDPVPFADPAQFTKWGKSTALDVQPVRVQQPMADRIDQHLRALDLAMLAAQPRPAWIREPQFIVDDPIVADDRNDEENF